jgi:hypothetical protein
MRRPICELLDATLTDLGNDFARCQYDRKDRWAKPPFLDILTVYVNVSGQISSCGRCRRRNSQGERGWPVEANRLNWRGRAGRIGSGTSMVRKLMVLGLVVAALSAGTSVAGAQSSARAPGAVIQEANALRAQIHRFHAGPGSWNGYSPPPVHYCRILSTGELVLKELVYLANRAIQYGPPSLVSPLQRAADGLGDELDHEEEINNQAGFNYAPNTYPCPAPNSPFAARAAVLVAVNQRMPACRVKANALRLTAAARRNLMQQCLRVIP